MKHLIYLTLIMAISCKKNQPIIFEDDFDCIPCLSDYCVPVQSGDTSQIQVDLSEFISTNLITNGTFADATGWTLGADWAVASGTANYTLGIPGTSISRDCDIDLVPGYYLIKMRVVVQDASGGLNLTVSLGGTEVSQIGGLAATQFQNQTFYLFKYLTPSNNTFEVLGASYNQKIDDIEIYLLSAIQYTIKDCETDEVFYLDDANATIDYYETGDVSNGVSVSSVTSGYAIISIDWESLNLANACYCLCVQDSSLIGYEYIQNGGFGSTDDWTITNTGAAGWAIGAGVASHSNIGVVGPDTIEQELFQPLDATLCYNLTLDVIAAGSYSIEIYYDTAGLSDQFLVALAGTGNGTSMVDITNIAIETIKFQAPNGGGLFDIDNVSIVADPECVPCVTSNCISLKESWDAWATARKMCNILVTGTNDNSAFGFSAGYDFVGRIFGVIRNSSYPDIDNTEYKDLTGLKSLQYNDNEAISELQVYEVPVGVHNWLRLALRCQSLTLNINGTDKTFIKKPGDYTPNWRKTSPDAPVIVEILETQQTSPNARNV